MSKTRQGTLDELASLLKRFGKGTCEPSKAFPVVASMISDKDAQVRRSALAALRCVCLSLFFSIEGAEVDHG